MSVLLRRSSLSDIGRLTASKTLDLKLKTPDNVKIGAWFVLSEAEYQRSGGFNRTSPPSADEVTQALETHPTVLYFHGNAASRAVKYRVHFYEQMTGRLSECIYASWK